MPTNSCRFFFLLSWNVLVPYRVPSLWREGWADVRLPWTWTSLPADPTPSQYSPDCQTLQRTLSTWTQTYTKMEDHSPNPPPPLLKHLPHNSLSLLLHVIRKTFLTRGVLPGAADGAHSIGVAGALGHTVHLTTGTVHLPHTHWPVLKTQHTDVNLNVLKQSFGLRFMECMH